MDRSLPKCLLCLCLGLALALFGAFGAVSAGVGARAMVICGGDGPQLVMVDDQGNPLPHGMPCAKCPACAAAATAVALATPAEVPLALPQVRALRARLPDLTEPARTPVRPFPARAPPALA